MRSALLFMLVPLAAMLVMVAYTRRFGELWTASLGQLQGLAPLLLIAVIFAAGVEVLVPAEKIGRWLGEDSGVRGIGLAWAGGILTPGGGPVGLTLVAGVAKQGASTPVLLTYLVSLSTLSLIRVPLEAAIVGGRLTTLRVLACLLLPPVVGLGARLLRL